MAVACTASRQAARFFGRAAARRHAGRGPGLFLADLCLDGPVAHFRPASSRRVLRIQSQPDDDRAVAALRGSVCRGNKRPGSSPCANRPEISRGPELCAIARSVRASVSRDGPALARPKKTCFTVRAFEGRNEGSTGRHAVQTRPDARHSDSRGRGSGFRAGQLRHADPAGRTGWPHRHPATD